MPRKGLSNFDDYDDGFDDDDDDAYDYDYDVDEDGKHLHIPFLWWPLLTFS